MSQLSNLRVNLAGHSIVPLFIGGMGVNVSTAELASVASRFGAVGHISDAMVLWVADRNTGSNFTKQKSEKFRLSAATLDKTDVKFELSELREAEAVHVADAMEKKQGPGAVFINVMEKLSMGDPLETLRARLHGALDGGIDGITLSAGLHSHSLRLMEDHPRFNSTALGIIVSSDRALKIFLRSAARVGRMPDYIVVEGPLAGGHLGFGEDWREHTLAGVTEKVLYLLKEEKLEIPVFGAGGIFDAEDAKKMLAIGASGVQVATRFAVTAESGLPDDVKQHYIAAREEDVVVNSVSPTGYLMRMLKNSPCLSSNVRPSCEPFGYMLSKEGRCAYIDAYANTATNGGGKKLPVQEKICLCHHFSKNDCYTCGANVYRIKETTTLESNGEYRIPKAEEVMEDYLFGGQRTKVNMLPSNASHSEEMMPGV